MSFEQLTNWTIITLALGVFVGNWLVCPLFFERTFKDGFWIGVIAAVLVLIFGKLFGLGE